MELSTEYYERCDEAARAAGSAPGWNARFRAALRERGLEIVPLVEAPERQASSAYPHGYPLTAPPPMPGDPEPWAQSDVLAWDAGALRKAAAAA